MESTDVKVRRSSLVEEVHRRLKAKIVEGEWAVGSRLPSEEELARTYGVSRNTIRGALYKLNSSGMVETIHGSGSYVCRTISTSSKELVAPRHRLLAAQVANVLEYRRAVEPESAYLAAMRRDLPDLVGIERAVNDMIRYSSDVEKYSEADLRFHLGIAEASKNDVFYTELSLISDLLTDHFVEMNFSFGSQFSANDHMEIYRAIRAREADRAKELMCQLIERSLNMLRE